MNLTELATALEIAKSVEFAAHIKFRESDSEFWRLHYDACKRRRQAVYSQWEAARLADLAG